MNNRSNDSPRELFRPIRADRVADKVAAQLKLAISSGAIKVGERLPSERELAEQMGVSRPSVREALQKLEILGMVQAIQGGGTVVKNLTEQEIRTPIEIVLGEDRQKVVELTEVRACMESWAAREAAMEKD